ncbi:DUF2256 domain-containing protein [Mucilaginibacter antarcticus]|uniref:DUF2256 domain-containing protein n=1 Tax=Mucilaginibacter antarcticus TaxID=1855725 RepID=A0ABW5XV25_9SPHI
MPLKVCVICGQPFNWRKSGKGFGTKLNTLSDKCRNH